MNRAIVMSDSRPAGPAHPSSETSARLHARWRIVLLQGIAMIVLGMLAAALPVLTTFAITALIGWLLLAGGVWRAIQVIRTGSAPGFGWSLALAVAAMALGVMLLMLPLPGALTLTLMLAALFVIEGIGKIMLALDLRHHAQVWGWPLASGALDLVLAMLIMAGWPATAAWAIGLLVGINMVFFGISLTAIALAARRARQQVLERIASPNVSAQEPRAT